MPEPTGNIGYGSFLGIDFSSLKPLFLLKGNK